MVSLPEELLQHIFDELRIWTESEDREEIKLKLRTLKSISLSNKAFRRLARPILWRSLDFRWRSWSRSALAIRRIIADDFQCARLVKELRLSPWRVSKTIEDREWDQENRDSVGVEWLPTSSPLQDKVLDGLQSRSEDAEMAFFLAVCTSIEYLEFSWPHPFKQSLAWAVARLSIKAGQVKGLFPAPLHCLRSLRIQHFAGVGWIQLHEILPLLRIPSLRTLHARELNIRYKKLPLHVHSPVRTIDLTSSSITAAPERSDFWILLKVCSSLASLSMHWPHLSDESEINYTSIGNALREIASDLEKLSLDPVASLRPRQPACGSLGTLRPLRHLKTLELALDCWFPRVKRLEGEATALGSLLPLSLERLTIFLDLSRYELVEVQAQLEQLCRDSTFEHLFMVQVRTYMRVKLHILTMCIWKGSYVYNARYADWCADSNYIAAVAKLPKRHLRRPRQD